MGDTWSLDYRSHGLGFGAKIQAAGLRFRVYGSKG